MNTVLDVLKLRKVRLDYVSPPICPILWSGSGSNLVLEAMGELAVPANIRIAGLCFKFILWDYNPDFEGMSLLTSTNGGNSFSLLLEGLPSGYVGVTSPGWWKVVSIFDDGSTLTSDPVQSTGAGYVQVPIPNYDEAVEYQLFKNPDPTDSSKEYTLVLTDDSSGTFEINSVTACFAVQAISDFGVSSLSQMVCAEIPPAGCFPAFQCPPLYVWDSVVESCVRDDLNDIVGNLPEFCSGGSYFGTITAVGGIAPFSWQVVGGALPAGMVLDPGPNMSGSTNLSGTPTGSGLFSFTVRVTDGASQSTDKSFTVIGLEWITAMGLPTAYCDTPGYSEQLVTAGGTAPVTFAVTIGQLPSGMSMSSSGLITGTPDLEDSQIFTVTATDASGLTCDKEFALPVFTICDNTYPVIPKWTTNLTVYQDFDPVKRRLWTSGFFTYPNPPEVSIFSTKLTPSFIQFAHYHVAWSPSSGGSPSEIVCFPNTRYAMIFNGNGNGQRNWFSLDTMDYIGSENEGLGTCPDFTVSRGGKDVVNGFLYVTARDYKTHSGYVVGAIPDSFGRHVIISYKDTGGGASGSSLLCNAGYDPNTDTVYVGEGTGSYVYNKIPGTEVRAGSINLTVTHISNPPNPGPTYHSPFVLNALNMIFVTTGAGKVMVFALADDSGKGWTADQCLKTWSFVAGTTWDYALYDPCRDWVILSNGSQGGPIYWFRVSNANPSLWTNGTLSAGAEYMTYINYDTCNGLVFGLKGNVDATHPKINTI